jgi:outer membrane protein assembly factor BamD (BamD/ComL family)
VESLVDIAAATRTSMLRMGKTWYHLGKINQAVQTYLRVVREHPGTEEAESAKLDLLEIAQGFEAEGQYYLAIDILDRLSAAVKVAA